MGLRSGFQLSPFNSGVPAIGPAGRQIKIGDDTIAPLEFVGGFDPAQDAISPFIAQQLAGVGRRLEARADAPGLTPFSRLAASRADQQAGALAAEGRSQLASRGGFRSGAGERLESDALRNRLLARSQIAQTNEQARQAAEGQLAQLGVNKANILSRTAGLDQAAKLREAERATQFTKDRFGAEAAASGAFLNAQAIRNSGKK